MISISRNSTLRADKSKNIFLYRYSTAVIIAAVSITALALRMRLFGKVTSDYTIFLKKWCDYLKIKGFSGIADIKSDYNVIYLYFLYAFTKIDLSYLYSIKILSIVFDFICAVGCGLIAGSFYKGKNKSIISIVTYTMVILCPTVVLNGAAWAQCDIIYTTFIVYSIYFLIKKKYNISFILYGIALSFKLQAIFVLPLFVILFFNKKEIKLRNFLYIPLVNFNIYIPALIAGRPLKMMINIYCKRVNHYNKLVMNFPNIYNFMPTKSTVIRNGGVCFTILILAVLLFIIMKKKIKITNSKIIELAVLLVIMETYFLPSMHDRYMFAADVLSIVYFMIKKNHIEVPVITVMMSYNSYMIPFKGRHIIDIHIAAVFMFAVISILSYEFLFKEGKYKNKKNIAYERKIEKQIGV